MSKAFTSSSIWCNFRRWDWIILKFFSNWIFLFYSNFNLYFYEDILFYAPYDFNSFIHFAISSLFFVRSVLASSDKSLTFKIYFFPCWSSACKAKALFFNFKRRFNFLHIFSSKYNFMTLVLPKQIICFISLIRLTTTASPRS